MAQQHDIAVRKGAGRPHRISLALDRLRERQGRTTLRVVVQANLPRGQGRPSRLLYQRVGSYLIDCTNPEAVAHARAELEKLMHRLAHPAKEVIAVAPAARGGAEDDPELKRLVQRPAHEAPASSAREGRPPEASLPKPAPLEPAQPTAEELWQRLRLF